METPKTKIETECGAGDSSSRLTCYPFIVSLMQAGYAIELTPLPDGETVNLKVTEAKNGSVEGCEVDMCGMEWMFAEEGIAERLKEASENLLG